MKLRKGVGSYKMPPVGEIISVVLDTGVREGRGYLVTLMMVRPEQFSKATEYGLPRYVALVGNRLLVRPIPDRPGWKLEITYTPPPQRI